MRSSTNAYLTALAIADLAYLLCIFWLSLTHYPQVKKNLTLANFYAYTWPYGVWLTDATSEYFFTCRQILLASEKKTGLLLTNGEKDIVLHDPLCCH